MSTNNCHVGCHDDNSIRHKSEIRIETTGRLTYESEVAGGEHQQGFRLSEQTLHTFVVGRRCLVSRNAGIYWDSLPSSRVSALITSLSGRSPCAYLPEKVFETAIFVCARIRFLMVFFRDFGRCSACPQGVRARYSCGFSGFRGNMGKKMWHSG